MKTPEPQGKEVDSHNFVDSDHAGDKVSHRSRSGFLMHITQPLCSDFGAEFVAMKQGRYALRGSR